MFSDLDLIEPHPLWQLEQDSSFHQDLTLSKKTVCERFFWERLYHLAISSSKRGVSPRSGQQPLFTQFTNASVNCLFTSLKISVVQDKIAIQQKELNCNLQ